MTDMNAGSTGPQDQSGPGAVGGPSAGPTPGAGPAGGTAPPPFGWKPIEQRPDFELSQDDRMQGMLCYLLGLAGIVIPFGNIIGPLIIWLVLREKSRFVDICGKESLNFQISVMIYLIVLTAVGGATVGICIGVVFLLAAGLVGLGALIMVILGGVKANEGVIYRLPVNLRLIK